jgi:HEAT repeat protein
MAMEATLAKFRKTRSPERKAAYAIALGLMGNEQSKNDLRDSMDRINDSSYRGYAAIALGLLNAKEHMAYISEVVDESKRDPELLKQASIGLGLMKDRNAVNKLLNYLTPEDGKRPRLAVLSAVATALGFIGDKNSVQPLVDTMSNDRITSLGRAFAAVSLGMVADKDSLPWNSVFGENLNYRAAVSTLVDQQAGTGILDIL